MILSNHLHIQVASWLPHHSLLFVYYVSGIKGKEVFSHNLQAAKWNRSQFSKTSWHQASSKTIIYLRFDGKVYCLNWHVSNKTTLMSGESYLFLHVLSPLRQKVSSYSSPCYPSIHQMPLICNHPPFHPLKFQFLLLNLENTS